MKLLCIILLSLSVMYCGNNKAIDDTYVSIYVLTRLANTEYGSTSKKAEAYRASIFKHYGVDENVYLTEINNLKDDPEQWLLFQERVIENIKQRDTALNQHEINMRRLDSLKRDSLLNDSINRAGLSDSLKHDSLTSDTIHLTKDTLQ